MLCKGPAARAVLIAGFIAVLGPAGNAGGQQPERVGQRIYFSVLDRSDKPVLGLTAADFTLRLSGRAAAIEGFRPGLPHTDRSIPLIAWILIDFNPNIRAEIIRGQAESATRFFELFHPTSAIGVKLVSDRSETLASLAHDPAAVRAAFEQFSQRRAELRSGSSADAVEVGKAGIMRAIELAIGEIESYARSQPSLQGREAHRAVMILSDGNVNPSVKARPLYDEAARAGVFLYPVFVPRPVYGPWLSSFFDLAKKTGGVASIFGALNPELDWISLSRPNTEANALVFNFIHMARDLNGKYSLVVPVPPAGKGTRLEIRCRIKGLELRVPRRHLP